MTGDGMREFYAQRLGSSRVMARLAINIMVTPSHWIMGVNIQVDKATEQVPTVNLTNALRRHFAAPPPRKYKDHYQLVPKVLLKWLQNRSSEPQREYQEE